MSKCSITKVRRQRAGSDSRLSQIIQTHSGTYRFLDQPSTMLFFLLSALFTVSAGEEITVTGFVEDDVLLPCSCPDRNLKEDFLWQLEEDKKGTQTKTIFKYNETSNVTDNQFEIFLNKDSSNCSMLLKNITSDSEGKYSCRFYSRAKYTYVFVNLKVCGTNISQSSQSTPSGGKLYHCNVTLDCYRKTDITWTLDGWCLTNSPTNHIAFNNTGHHHFYNTLETNSTNGSEPKCEVSPACPPERVIGPSQSTATTQYQHPDPFLKTLCKVVPVVLILGLLLIWCRRRGTSQRLPIEQDVENSDFSERSTNSDKLQNENVLSSYPEEVVNC